MANDGQLPVAGETLYLRLLVGESVAVVAITPEFQMALDGHPPDVFE